MASISGMDSTRVTGLMRAGCCNGTMGMPILSSGRCNVAEHAVQAAVQRIAG